MSDAADFTPTDESRAAFRALFNDESDRLMKTFFEIWEKDGSPQIAGSMVAHAYITLGARIAVFGAQCGSKEPDITRFQARATEAFQAALKDTGIAWSAVSDAMVIEEPKPEGAE